MATSNFSVQTKTEKNNHSKNNSMVEKIYYINNKLRVSHCVRPVNRPNFNDWFRNVQSIRTNKKN